MVWDLIIKGSFLLLVVYHIIDYTSDPPARYPDLWVILNISISFAAFALFWLWLNFRIYKLKV